MEKIEWSHVKRQMLVKHLRAKSAAYVRSGLDEADCGQREQLGQLRGEYRGARDMLRLIAPTIAQGIIDESERAAEASK